MIFETMNLSEIIQVKKGKYITKKESTIGPYPVILGGREPAYYIDQYNHTGKAIVVSRSGASAGYVSFWNEPIFVTDGFLIEPKKDVDMDFLYYLMKVHESELLGLQGGSAIPHVTPKTIGAVSVGLPSMEIQLKIAGVLLAYDSLIENNKKQIKLLEEVAQRLYKEWFVDLRFPRHEDVAIVDGVPKGWKEAKLIDIADVTMGQSPKSEFYNTEEKGLPFHQGVGSYGKRFVIDEIYSTSYTRIAEENSILFSVRAPVGRLNITKNKIVIGRGLAAIKHKFGYQNYLFYLLKERFFKDNLVGNGAIFASITKDELLNQTFLVSDEKLIIDFNEISKNIDTKINALDSQIQLLVQARDRLIPKLMSGEIEV